MFMPRSGNRIVAVRIVWTAGIQRLPAQDDTDHSRVPEQRSS
jgi:hypothetical protein